MTVLTKGLAMDFQRGGEEMKGMAITSIWPATAIESAATAQVTKTDESERKDLRKATIFSDAVGAMLRAETGRVNGLVDLDEDFLRREEGVRDFERYSVVEGARPRRIMPRVFPVLEVEEQEDEGRRVVSGKVEGGAKL